MQNDATRHRFMMMYDSKIA